MDFLIPQDAKPNAKKKIFLPGFFDAPPKSAKTCFTPTCKPKLNPQKGN
jgi:hypothetical protein